MLNFPVPYPDELIYSLVARAGIHLGLTSPKQLLDEVFANRHVIATVDLPNHLASLVQLLPESGLVAHVGEAPAGISSHGLSGDALNPAGTCFNGHCSAISSAKNLLWIPHE